MKKFLAVLISVLVFQMLIYAQEEARLMRFPAIYGDQVVFSYAGDLYTVSKAGGIARKLTNDDGYEMFSRFSPDGKSIAFTGQYDGNTEVYLMPAQGGIPERLTYTATLGRDDISDRMGPNNIVMCWKDNDSIVYRSRKKSFNSFKGQLFIVSTHGGLSEEIPLPCGGFCSYSPDKTKLAYNRVFREFRTWKYYKGGMADDIWIYDFKTKKVKNITNNDFQNIFPMWHHDFIYFLSDRDRTMNLFSIQIANDFVNGRSEMKDASKYINSWAVSPDGKRAVFGARGDVYTVPAKSGITKNLTESSGVHDRNVEWSPDGKYISFISDVTGEDEIYIIKQDGSEPPVQLTKNSTTYKYNPVWSTDSKKLLWGDKELYLKYIDIDTKKVTIVDKATDWEMRNYS
jgi:tricorn protease